MSVEPTYESLHRVFGAWKGDLFSYRPFGSVFLGCERRKDPAQYRWDGMRRGADPNHPGVIFQYTLGGQGRFEQGGKSWPIGQGRAFVTVVPSEHLYYLPNSSSGEAPSWSFFWFTFAHPYVVERVRGMLRNHPPVFDIQANSALMARSLSFFQNNCQGRFEDAFEEEAALLDWMLHLEKHLHDIAHPQKERERMLAEARSFALENLSAGVDELAGRHGVSRSHYSRLFHRVTGRSPASVMLAERLQEACRLLRETDLPLKSIALDTGFTDANHLCKVFRREMYMTPGHLRSHWNKAS